MKDGQASTTAALVALCRALGHLDPDLGTVCHDRYAARLVHPVHRPLLRLAQSSPQGARLTRVGSLGLVDHLAMRTHLIDVAVREALFEGARQLVLLGAGLDARAHRLSVLRDTAVFEVDHPDSQRVKRKLAADLPKACRVLHYAPCDFGRIRLTDALQGAGHDPGVPTAWVWEGVTPYLEPEVLRSSLAELRDLSAPGSTLIATYVTPELTLAADALGKLGAASLGGLFSEHVKGPITPSDFARVCAEHGFERLSDRVPVEVGSAMGLRRGPWARLIPAEHLAVLRRVPST